LQAVSLKTLHILCLSLSTLLQKKTNYWKDFAQKLAQLHKNTAPIFGLDHDNYIGSLPQSNRQTQKWTDFFISQRLEPLVTKAVASGLLDSQTAQRFDRLFSKLDQLIPEEKPALLHGDLWSGNVMTDEHGEVCLIDPAVYYGHREVDLAFSTLFGAFHGEFYEAYNEAFPLEKGWKQRIDLFNLYPLLVHLILFGRSYYHQVISTLEKFT
jgi:protein-ribulosamine 3-kinase